MIQVKLMQLRDKGGIFTAVFISALLLSNYAFENIIPAQVALYYGL